MKLGTLLPAALLAATLGAYGIANAEKDAPNAPPPHAHKMAHGGKDWEFRSELMEILPEDKQQLLRDAMEESRSQCRPIIEQIVKLHEEQEAILKAKEFDKDAFLKKSAEISELHSKFEQTHAKVIADVAAKFTPEERRVLVVMGHMMMQHGFGGPPGGPSHPGEEPPPPPAEEHGDNAWPEATHRP